MSKDDFLTGSQDLESKKEYINILIRLSSEIDVMKREIRATQEKSEERWTAIDVQVNDFTNKFNAFTSNFKTIERTLTIGILLIILAFGLLSLILLFKL